MRSCLQSFHTKMPWLTLPLLPIRSTRRKPIRIVTKLSACTTLYTAKHTFSIHRITIATQTFFILLHGARFRRRIDARLRLKKSRPKTESKIVNPGWTAKQTGVYCANRKSAKAHVAISFSDDLPPSYVDCDDYLRLVANRFTLSPSPIQRFSHTTLSLPRYCTV